MFSPDTIHMFLLHCGLLWYARMSPWLLQWPTGPFHFRWLTDRHQTWWKTDDCREAYSQLSFHWRVFMAARAKLLRKQLFNSWATTPRWVQRWRITSQYCLSRQENTTTRQHAASSDLCISCFCPQPPLCQCQRPPAPVWTQTLRRYVCFHSLLP